MGFHAPKGVPDYFAPRSREFLAIQSALSAPAEHAGYDYVELPVFEETALFVRGVGESTDVVSKEMYTFEDRGGRSLTLRPEGTAGVMRVVIEHGLERAQLPVKLWYRGPFFRAERPQHGRYRQLQQVGVEAIGSDDPALDAEVIALAAAAYKAIGLNLVQCHVTSLGCAECRPPYRAQLHNFLTSCDLDDQTRLRAQLNPLRVLDDKRSEVQEQLHDAPLMVDHLCQECQEHYDQVREYLRVLNVEWVEAPRMVRGLDYYTRTTFEFVHPLLGAQSGIGGGGRYDGLMASLGGADLSGIGFGLGVDRTLMAAEAEGISLGPSHVVDVIAIAIGESAKKELVGLVHELRGSGIRSDLIYGDRGLKGAMKSAARTHAPYALIMGEDECAAGTVQVKDMVSGEQEVIPRGEVVTFLSARTTHDKISP
jgi:histidyl-tRNA synthetase